MQVMSDDAWVGLLGDAGSVVHGAPVDVDEVRRAVRAAVEVGADPLLEGAAAAALRVTRWVASRDEALRAVRHGLPLFWVDAEGARLLVAVRGARASVRRPGGASAWVAASVLPEDGVWWLVEPAHPAEGIVGSDPDATPLQRLSRLLVSERRAVGTVLVYAVTVGVLSLATPLTVQVLTNTVAFGTAGPSLVLLVVALALSLGLAAILRILKRVVVEMLQRRVFTRVVSDAAWRLPRAAPSTWRAHGEIVLVNRFFDVLTLQKAAATLLVDGVAAVLQVGVGLTVLAVYHPLLLAFDIGLLVAIVLLVAVPGQRAVATALGESKAKYAVASWLETIGQRPELFRVAGGAAAAVDRADGLVRNYLRYRGKHFSWWLGQQAGAAIVSVTASVALLGVGGTLVIAGQLTLGQLVAAELIVASALAGLSKFTDKLESVYDLLAATDKLGQLAALPLEEQRGGALPSAPGGVAVALESVVYAHPGRAGALSGLNLVVAPGETKVIVGGEGAGKSLFADLLVGRRIPVEGHVRLDGRPTSDLRPEAVRGRVMLVRGRDVLPTFSLEENVTLGRSDIDRASARAALEAVGLGASVDRAENGLDTPLEDVRLSSNGLRRLVLARAIAARPRLMVIDRALDAFGPTAQDALRSALADGPWTLVILTQDLALARRSEAASMLTAGGGLRSLNSGLGPSLAGA